MNLTTDVYYNGLTVVEFGRTFLYVCCGVAQGGNCDPIKATICLLWTATAIMADEKYIGIAPGGQLEHWSVFNIKNLIVTLRSFSQSFTRYIIGWVLPLNVTIEISSASLRVIKSWRSKSDYLNDCSLYTLTTEAPLILDTIMCIPSIVSTAMSCA